MFDVIIPAAGNSVRAGFDKLNENIGSLTVLQRTVNAFLGIDGIEKIIVVGARPDIEGVCFAEGGNTRAESVANALEQVTADYVLIHDGARPFVSKDLIRSVMETTVAFGSAVPTLPLTDTIMRKEGNSLTVGEDRSAYLAVQTPQGYRAEPLKRAFSAAKGKMASGRLYTDESSLYAEFIAPCRFLPGEVTNRKITYEYDFCGSNARVGTGFDFHRFLRNKPLRLCGVDIESDYGLLAHSDGDVCLHALMDALLTAVADRDIGYHFPDSSPEYEGIDSTLLLSKVLDILKDKNAEVISVNLVIIAQNPKLSPYIEKMRTSLSALLSLSPEKIGISATTTENVGLTAENKGIATLATVIVF